MKKCISCHEWHEDSLFEWDTKARNMCKACRAKQAKKNWHKNRCSSISNNYKNKLHRRIALRNYVFDYLKIHSCIDCGESDPVVLEFDHIDRTNKKYEISNIIQAALSLETLKTEIEKCVVRCSNCHRKKSAQEDNYWIIRWAANDGCPPNEIENSLAKRSITHIV